MASGRKDPQRLGCEHDLLCVNTITLEPPGNLGELTGSIEVILSLVYLGRQIQQQNTFTRAPFGHSPTQRLYERNFQTSQDEDYARIMTIDWASKDRRAVESWLDASWSDETPYPDFVTQLFVVRWETYS